MKKYISLIVFLCAVSLILLGYPSTAQIPKTLVSSWDLVRSEGNEDGATSSACLDLTTAGDWANHSATAYVLGYNSESRVNSNETEKVRCVLTFCGGADSSPADETFSYVIYGYAWGNGPAELIAEGDGVIGTQAVVKYPHSGSSATNRNWADTINVDDTSNWISGVLVSDSGNNRLCRLSFDATGLYCIKVYIYDAAATAGETGNLSVYGRFY